MAVLAQLRAPQTLTPGTATNRAARVLTPESIFQEHAGRVYRLARRMLGSHADAEDVLQDTLLQVVRRLHTFRGKAEFTTWLHRVTVNAALLHRRKTSRRPERTMAASLDQLPYDRVMAQSKGPDRQALDREERQLIKQAIAGLPPIYRSAYVLADVEGLSNLEIAEQLGLRLAAVKSRLHRARRLMHEALAPHFQEGAPQTC